MSHEDKSRKRGREDSEPIVVVPPFEILRRRYLEIDAKIAQFKKVYDENSTEISAHLEKARMRAAELKAGMFTAVVESPAELYINAVEMLFEQSIIVYKACELNSDISAYLKTASPDESIRLTEYKNRLTNFIIFIGQEVNIFVRIYQESKDAFLKAGVKRALSENPPLQVWLDTFVNVEGEDPLVVVVTNEVNRLRKDAVEVLKGVFDAQVDAKLKELGPKIDAILEQADKFELEAKEREFKCYQDEVAFYAEHCVKTLVGVLDLIDELKKLEHISDKCIRDIQSLDQASDISDLTRTLAEVRQWRSSLENEKDSIYRPMRALVKMYAEHRKTLSDKLRAFMKPWLDPEHPIPLSASIYAYENPNYFPETHTHLISETTSQNFALNLRF